MDDMGLMRAFWRVLIAVPPVWILVLNQLLFVQVGLAESQSPHLRLVHQDAIVNCKGNILYKEAVKVADDVLLDPTGFLAEHYDTNEDGKVDVVAFSTAIGTRGDHRVNPVYWMVDLDFDGKPDAVYIDKKGLGKCTDIVLYEELFERELSDEVPSRDRGRGM